MITSEFNYKKLITGRLFICLFSILVISGISNANPRHQSTFAQQTMPHHAGQGHYVLSELEENYPRIHETETSGNERNPEFGPAGFKRNFDPIMFKRSYFDPIMFKRTYFDPIMFKRSYFDPIMFKRTYFDPIMFKRTYFDPIMYKRSSEYHSD
uniref:Uncharacterized protein n=1 Tax=Trichobilharzia regenti TaxID=157069 RepID=A0AA85JST9_TRIRE|nr:unnamed protein product [Trichobilharzia regenti]